MPHNTEMCFSQKDSRTDPLDHARDKQHNGRQMAGFDY